MSFCQKQLLYILDNSGFVSLRCLFDCGGPDQLCVIRVVLGSQPGSSFCGHVKYVTLLEQEYHVVTDSLEEVSCIPENILCEVYVVKIWEGIV